MRRMSRSRLLLMVILALSLLGNAVTLGAVWRLQELRVELVGAGQALPTFPRDVRAALRAELDANPQVVKPKVQAMIAARAKVVATTQTGHFDRAATEAAMTEFRVALDAAVQAFQGVILNVLEYRSDQKEAQLGPHG